MAPAFITNPNRREEMVDLFKLPSFKDFQVIENAEIFEPLILTTEAKKLFGLVDMSGAGPKEKPNLLRNEWPCPHDCSPKSKHWICKTCGGFVEKSDVKLFCHCGVKVFDSSALICLHPSHVQPVLEPQPVPENNPQNAAVDGTFDEKIKTLIVQFQKTLREEKISETDKKLITKVIAVLSNPDSTNDEIIASLHQINTIPLDGDSQDIISSICGSQ
uniref:Uncharacterized protein n=1 Tax=Panagrolaimus sp. JU765 TaxID=591449 RepID=A0AC34QM34_9BILA